MKIKGFTPVFDVLVDTYGHTVALVYGKIWRYCNWSAMGLCTESNAELALQLNLSDKTVREAKKLLNKDKLIRVSGRKGHTDSVSVCHDIVMQLGLENITDDSGNSYLPTPTGTPEEITDKDIVDSTEEIAPPSLDPIKHMLGGEVDPYNEYPVDVQQRGQEWTRVSGIVPIETDKAEYITAFREWITREYPIEDIEEAYEYAVANWTVASPRAITKAFAHLKGSSKWEGELFND